MHFCNGKYCGASRKLEQLKKKCIHSPRCNLYSRRSNPFGSKKEFGKIQYKKSDSNQDWKKQEQNVKVVKMDTRKIKEEHNFKEENTQARRDKSG